MSQTVSTLMSAPEAIDPIKGSLVVSLITWEAADLTIDCLRSVEAEIETVADFRVVVVDNGSRDGSDKKVEQAIIENAWDSWATFVRAQGNHGFGAGNNIVFKEVLEDERATDFVVMLNPDTIVRPGAFRILVDFMRRHPEVGIAGGRSEDPDETPQLCCFRFPNILSELSLYLKIGIVDHLLQRFLTKVPIPELNRQIDWVSGALMIVRREVLEDVGLMDEGYFLYYEETDFTLRARRAGWTCWHVPKSRIVHFVGQSTGVTTRGVKPDRRPKYWYESRHRYFVKNHGLLYAAVVDACAISACALWRARRSIQRKPDYDPPHLLGDLIRHSVFVRGRKLNSPEEARPESA